MSRKEKGVFLSDICEGKTTPFCTSHVTPIRLLIVPTSVHKSKLSFEPKRKKTVFFCACSTPLLCFFLRKKQKKKQLKVGGRHFNFHHFHANPKGRVELFLGALLMPATPSLFS